MVKKNENKIKKEPTTVAILLKSILLKKEFPHINWIADYRDDWSTTELKSPKSFPEKII